MFDSHWRFSATGQRPLLTTGLLAVSVGLTGGLWAVVDAGALRPLAYPEAHQLVAVMEITSIQQRPFAQSSCRKRTVTCCRVFVY
jgi:hypothetical protein